MFIKLFYFMLLGLINFTCGTLILQINKLAENIIYPVSSNYVEGNVGTSFSLVCELISSPNETDLYDDHLIWKKDNQVLTNNNNNEHKNTINGINKSEKKFHPLLYEDKGHYICISNKFNKSKEVEVNVRTELIRKVPKLLREIIYCNEHMFQCNSNGHCIIAHYVCDGKSDCKDGSDESIQKCNGEPCKGKIPCDDGRCIPSVWCCDHHHDPNCTVTNRPTCCPDTYEELELGYPPVAHSQHLFILVCFFSILFSVILLLLIISKVVLLAKKSALNARVCENALRNQTNINVIPCNLYTYRTSSRTPRNGNIVRNIIIDSSDVNDPLLFNPSRFNVINASDVFDQPPSYVDVVQNNRLVTAEPPPPYQSQEALNLPPVEESNETV